MLKELRLPAVNTALAVVYALFAYAHVHEYLEQPRLSLLLLVAMETALVAIFLVRKAPDFTWHSWQTWATTAAGTLFPLFLRPIAAGNDLLIGQLVQTAGCALQVAAVLSLNRSMGLLPAHRDVKSSGLYRVVRHPLYAAYTVALLGYLLNNWSLYNVLVLAAGTAFQILRIRNEESLLSRYPEYLVLTAKTRWRLMPFVW